MKIEKSCGAVLFTEINGERCYVLVSVDPKSNCGFPKGHVEHNETEEETALREIWEETCVKAEIVSGFRRDITYLMPNGHQKQVTYFIARYEKQLARKNPSEKLDIMLLPLREAMEAISFDNVREILREADQWLTSR